VHHIKLQTTRGDFDPAFLKRLPALEKAMSNHGLDPSAFVIGKHEAQSPRLPIAFSPAGQPSEYTVFVKGRSFTVTQPDDLGFLAYFWGLCFPSAEKKDDPKSLGYKLHSAEKKMEILIGRLEAWLNKPI
jgi:hypothetical protein